MAPGGRRDDRPWRIAPPRSGFSAGVSARGVPRAPASGAAHSRPGLLSRSPPAHAGRSRRARVCPRPPARAPAARQPFCSVVRRPARACQIAHHVHTQGVGRGIRHRRRPAQAATGVRNRIGTSALVRRHAADDGRLAALTGVRISTARPAGPRGSECAHHVQSRRRAAAACGRRGQVRPPRASGTRRVASLAGRGACRGRRRRRRVTRGPRRRPRRPGGRDPAGSSSARRDPAEQLGPRRPRSARSPRRLPWRRPRRPRRSERVRAGTIRR